MSSFVWSRNLNNQTSYTSWAVVPQKKEDRYCIYKHNFEACSHNQCCNGRAMSIIYSECVSVTLVFQHSVPMLRIVLYLWPVWLYHILAHSHKRQDFRKNFIENKMRVLIFSTRFVWKTFYSKNNSAIYHKCTRHSCKIPVTIARLYWNLNFLDRLS